MMGKYDALEWQAFSQKKNIETIAKNVQDKNDIQLTASIEIAMMVSSVVAENLFSSNTPKWLWWAIFVISVIPLLWLAFKYARRFYHKHRVGNDIPDAAAMIDLFDNDICYYILMADSYTDKVSNENSNINQFYFIEACFYTCKAIYNLSRMSNCIDKVFSYEYTELFCSRKVSYTRVKNVFDILERCISILTQKFNLIADIDANNSQKNLFEKYTEQYELFKMAINRFYMT